MFQIRLKQLRENTGLSQSNFAKEIGVAQSTVGNWESGKREPDYNTTKIIADYFKVTVDYLLGRSNDPTPPNSKSPVYDDEALEMMEEMHKRPELKVLFNTTRKVKKEDIEFIDQMVKRMAGEYRD